MGDFVISLFVEAGPLFCSSNQMRLRRDSTPMTGTSDSPLCLMFLGLGLARNLLIDVAFLSRYDSRKILCRLQLALFTVRHTSSGT
jgi:hypothetical protein